MDSMDRAITLGISRTAAHLLSKLEGLLYASTLNGVKDSGGYYVYASHKTLAEKIDRTERTVQRALTELKRAGLIRVRRTRGNAHIYINAITNTGGKNVVSRTDILVTYNKPISYNNTIDISIYQQEQTAAEQVEAVALKKMDELNRGTTPAKGRPTPKRTRRTHAERQARREKFKAMLNTRLCLTDGRHTTYEEREEFEAANALADMVAAAACTEGARIAVGGRRMTGEEYFEGAQYIQPRSVSAVLERIEQARITTGIKNINAYTLAAVYNQSQYDRLTCQSAMDTMAL